MIAHSTTRPAPHAPRHQREANGRRARSVRAAWRLPTALISVVAAALGATSAIAKPALTGRDLARTAAHPAGYLARPAAGKGPGVLVIHSWWGLDDTFKGICDRLARHGFVAFAPDLYHGKVVHSVAAAQAMANGLDAKRALADLRAAKQFLARESTEPTRLAVIGFSLGGYYALDLAAKYPKNIASAVVFYGTGGPMDFSRSKADFMGHFAAKDPYNSDADVKTLAASLKHAHRPMSFYHYPNTGHWLVEPDVKSAYNEAAARLAWRRTFRFLKARAGMH